MSTATQLIALAETRLGEKYVNVRVPKDNSNWHGPWDCAEFASWLVYQTTGKLYGCTDNTDNPALSEAYSGAWVRDAKNGTLLPSSEDEATSTPGVFLIRTPPSTGQNGARCSIRWLWSNSGSSRSGAGGSQRQGTWQVVALRRQDP